MLGQYHIINTCDVKDVGYVELVAYMVAVQ